jgi:hypothetical protein
MLEKRVFWHHHYFIVSPPHQTSWSVLYFYSQTSQLVASYMYDKGDCIEDLTVRYHAEGSKKLNACIVERGDGSYDNTGLFLYIRQLL